MDEDIKPESKYLFTVKGVGLTWKALMGIIIVVILVTVAVVSSKGTGFKIGGVDKFDIEAEVSKFNAFQEKLKKERSNI